VTPRIFPTTATACLALALAAGQVSAQRSGRDQPTAIAVRAANIWNGATTRQVNGAFELPAGEVIDGSVAVLNGPVTVAGTIRGSLAAINADVRLAPGARIERDLVIVGGNIAGIDQATLTGELAQQAELMRYRIDDVRLDPEGEPTYDDGWWSARKRVRDWRNAVGSQEFLYVASRTYNRVEGWSFVAGPRVMRPTPFGAVNLELFGVGRTAPPMQWDNATIGHNAKAEVLFGRRVGVAVGARAFDVVQPTETWQLGEGEVGLGAALLHRDFRDYYSRHGGEVFARFVAGRGADVTIALSDEQWANREARDPWSFSRGDRNWRPNPSFDVGSVHLLSTRLRLDTRDRVRSPWGAWYIAADLEQGGGRLTRLGAPILPIVPLQPEPVWYSRAFLDVRRYNRLAPGMALALRVAGGGWVAGDPLPTQRRLGVGGAGTLPGYDFRGEEPGRDRLSCTTTIIQAGTPAQCDRVILAQAELRSSFLFDGVRNDQDDDWWRPGFNGRTAWVLFADAGRGWMVGPANAARPEMFYERGALPPFSSYRTDVGAGVDFGELGLYWAKALDRDDSPVRFILRLQRRF